MLTPSNGTEYSVRSISNKTPSAAGIDPQVQSLKFEDIRTLPTGSYYRNPIVEKVDKHEVFAGMNKEQIERKIKKNFRGIF